MGSAYQAADASALSVAFCLRRDFLAGRPFPFAADLSMANSSRFFPFLISAASQRGIAPRPAHVSDRFFGLRYFGATFRPFILLTRLPVDFPPEGSHPPSPRAASWLCSWPALRLRTSPISSRSLRS